MRKLVRLARIATDTRGDDVLPSRRASFIPGQDMIEIQIRLRENLGAVLAGMLIPEKDVLARQPHFHARDLVIERKYNNAWHAQRQLHAVDQFIHHGRGRVLDPGLQAMRPVAILSVRLHDLRMAEDE